MTWLDVRLPWSITSNSQHPLYDLHLIGHLPPSMNSRDIMTGVIVVATSVGLSIFDMCLKQLHTLR